MTDDREFIGLLSKRAQADADRLYARFGSHELSFGELDRASGSFAFELARMGLRPGDRAAVMLRNGPASVITALGLAKAGIIWVPVNVQQVSTGLRYILEHSAPRLVITEPDLCDAVRHCGADLDGVHLLTNGNDKAGASLAPLFSGTPPAAGTLPKGTDPFAILYTSGTTGKPKGAIISHAMMRFAGEATALVTQAEAGDVLYMWEPLYHIGGAQLLVLPLIRDVVLAIDPKFSAGRFWQRVRDTGATHIHYLGGILQILLKQPADPLDKAHHVRIAWGGGCPKEIWRAFEERFGVAIRECYGMTEASSITSFNDTGTVGSIGRPVPWFRVEILDGHGQPLGPGERGQIVVADLEHGALFSGYWNNAEATGQVLAPDLLYTGDYGTLDQAGNLFFHGRMSDSVRCRGENVSAWEVENVVAKHPGVADCAMIGVPAEIGEQDIKLFIKPVPGVDINQADIWAWLADRLAKYQLPRYIALVKEFERTPSHRIMKHRLSKSLDDCWDRLTVRDDTSAG